MDVTEFAYYDEEDFSGQDEIINLNDLSDNNIIDLEKPIELNLLDGNSIPDPSSCGDSITPPMYQLLSEKNKLNGYAGLDSDGKIDYLYLPNDVVKTSDLANYALVSGLGTLATKSNIGLSDLNNTIVTSGKIKATLIDANQVRIDGGGLNGSQVDQRVALGAALAVEGLENNLGGLAFQNAVEIAMLGESILIGGYFKTQLINTNALVVAGLASKAYADQAATQAASAAVVVLQDGLGDLAFLNAIGLAKLDNTIIVGGYLKTTLIDANALRIQGGYATPGQITAALNSLSANLGSLAYQNAVEKSMLGTTIIVGGYVKADLLDAGAIVINGGGITDAIANTKISQAIAAINPAQFNLGSLAYQNLISKAQLDSTIIDGGLIRTSLIQAQAVVLAGGGQTSSQVQASISTAIGNITLEQLGAGDLAYANAITEAMLQDTIMIGGFIKTSVIQANAVVIGGGGVLTSTIIADGKLKTNLIDTNELIAKKLAADEGTIANFTIVGDSLQSVSGGYSITLNAQAGYPYIEIAAPGSFTRIDQQGLATKYLEVDHIGIGRHKESQYTNETAVFLNCEYIFSRHGWLSSGPNAGDAWYGGRTGAYSADDGVFYRRTNFGPELNVYKLTGVTVLGNTVQYYTLTNLSDSRFKRDIAPLNYGLDEVMQLNPISFKYTQEGNPMDYDSTHLGLLAQEVEEIMPELVKESGARLTLSTTELIPVLVKAIKQLNQRIDELTN